PEFTENLTLVRGHHTLKMGGYALFRDNRSDSRTFMPGRFVFGSLPGGVLSPCLQVPAACGLSNVTPATIDSLQNVNLGLPLFYQQGFGSQPPNGGQTQSGIVSSINPLSAFYIQDSWKIRPNFTLNAGLRYEHDSRYNPLPTDGNNVAPRVSMAWDPFK